MYDLTALISVERRIEEHHRQLRRHRVLRGAQDLPRTTVPHPVRTWVGLRLINLGGALAGASAHAAIAAPRATNPEVGTVV